MPPTEQLHTPEMHEKNNRSKTVSLYLRSLEGDTASPEEIRRKIAKLTEKIAKTSGVNKLRLIQDRLDLRSRLNNIKDTTSLEERFIAVAAQFSVENGISWSAWRVIGVPVKVLEAAKIPRKDFGGVHHSALNGSTNGSTPVVEASETAQLSPTEG